MFENESVNSDVESVESSPAPETESSTEREAKASPQESKPETPFHEHPRFKELVEQKNQFAKRAEEFERELKDLRSRFDKPKETQESAEQKLINRLKGIDPEFGTWAEQQEAARRELAELRTWKTQTEQMNYLNAAKSAAEKVQSELKVSPELHQMYLTQIPMGTPVEKVAEIYKSLNDKVSKLFEAREREVLSKYGQAKKADSKVPAAAKSQPVKPGRPTQAPKYSKDSQEARAQIVANAMRTLKNQ